MNEHFLLCCRLPARYPSKFQSKLPDRSALVVTAAVEAVSAVEVVSAEEEDSVAAPVVMAVAIIKMNFL